MKDWSKQITVGIIVSFIVCFLIYYFNIQNFLSNYVPTAGQTVQKLKDLMYYKAGQMSLFNFISSQLCFIYGIVSGFIASMITGVIIKVYEKDNKREKQNNAETKKLLYLKYKRQMILSSTLSIITLLIYLIVFYYYSLKPAMMWDSFEIAITKITPYEKDTEIIKVLRSKWVSMNSKEDYLEIKEYIDAKIKEVDEIRKKVDEVKINIEEKKKNN